MEEALISDGEQGCPRSWSLYFPEDEHAVEDRRAVLLHELLSRLDSRAEWLANRLHPRQTTGRHCLSISFEELQNACQSSELSIALDLQPVEALACLGAAAHEVGSAVPAAQKCDQVCNSTCASTVVSWQHSYCNVIQKFNCMGWPCKTGSSWPSRQVSFQTGTQH